MMSAEAYSAPQHPTLLHCLVAEAPRDATPDEPGQNPHLSPSSNADSLSSPESMSRYDSMHQREDLAASLARESCTSAQSDAR